jgi:hypothetical protein
LDDDQVRGKDGAAVHVLRDDEVLEGGAGVRFRLVCQTDEVEEAERAAVLMRERVLTGEIR